MASADNNCIIGNLFIRIRISNYWILAMSDDE